MTKISLLFLIYILIALVTVNAQVSNTISNVEIGPAKEGMPLKVTAELFQSQSTFNVQFAYRAFNESEFKISEMEIINNKAEFIIPADEVKMPSISYYLIIELGNGTTETYPMGVPETAAPLQIQILSSSSKDKEVILLNPAPNEIVPQEDFFISVSLIRAPDNINRRATRILVNGEDISDKVLFAGDLLTFNSANFPGLMSEGTKNVEVLTYDETGKLYHSIQSSFTARPRAKVEEIAQKFSYNGVLTGESINESINGTNTWTNNFRADINGSYNDWNFKGYAFVTSEEQSDQQARNRFLASVESNWLKLRAGDTYPVYPQLIMNGKRIRGISGSIELGFFNIKASFGEINRSSEGILLNLYTRDNVPVQSNIIPIDSVKYDGYSYGEVRAGTYKRSIFMVRPSFGSGEIFQWGLTYLHSKDDMNSIEFGGSPKENVVFGTDLNLNLDKRNIVFKAQAAVSMLNKDISTGELTDAEIDTLFGGENSFVDIDPAVVKDIKKIAGKFITVNQNITPLNPQELSSLAAETSLQLNYFMNNLRASYIYRGNEYNSYGRDFLRKDVKGINIADRVRLIDNKLFVTIGYENLQDNLQQTKMATTTYNTFNASVSIFPRTNFPNITLGYSKNSTKNDIDADDVERIAYIIDNTTNRLSANISYDIRSNVKHAASLNLISSSSDDATQKNIDSKYFSGSASVNSYWTAKFTSFFRVSLYNSEIDTSNYKYTSFSFGGRYKLLSDKLELSGSIKPTFGDLKQQVLDLVADYQLIKNLNLGFQFRLYRTEGRSTDTVSGLTLRYNLI